MRTNIIIAMENVLFREALREILILNGYNVLQVTANVKEVYDLIINCSPHAFLFDSKILNDNELSFPKLKKQNNLRTKVIVLSDLTEISIGGVENEIDGFISLRSGVNQFLFSLSNFLVDDSRIEDHSRRPSDTSFVKEGNDSTCLTKREIEILGQIAKYSSSTEIAEKLSLSVSTVNNHKANIVKKMNLKGSNAILKFASKLSNAKA